MARRGGRGGRRGRAPPSSPPHRLAAARRRAGRLRRRGPARPGHPTPTSGSGRSTRSTWRATRSWSPACTSCTARATAARDRAGLVDAAILAHHRGARLLGIPRRAGVIGTACADQGGAAVAYLVLDVALLGVATRLVVRRADPGRARRCWPSGSRRSCVTDVVYRARPLGDRADLSRPAAPRLAARRRPAGRGRAAPRRAPARPPTRSRREALSRCPAGAARRRSSSSRRR